MEKRGQEGPSQKDADARRREYISTVYKMPSNVVSLQHL